MTHPNSDFKVVDFAWEELDAALGDVVTPRDRPRYEVRPTDADAGLASVDDPDDIPALFIDELPANPEALGAILDTVPGIEIASHYTVFEYVNTHELDAERCDSHALVGYELPVYALIRLQPGRWTLAPDGRANSSAVNPLPPLAGQAEV